MRRISIFALFMAIAVCVFAADPTATSYSADDCRGSLSPYPAVSGIEAYPDSLTPVFITHVGRHGSRYPASSQHTLALLQLLQRADSAGTITPLGKRLMAVAQYVANVSDGRWGALDSLGMAEQRGIASRMYMAYPEVFKGAKIRAISSYSPRCMMSMMSFTHQIDRLNNKVEITTSTGRSNSALLRPFDVDEDYLDFRKAGRWSQPYEDYLNAFLPLTALRRVVGESFEMDETEERDMALAEYYVIAGLDAMGLDCDEKEFFTTEEINALWSAFNLRQYLQRAASTISTVPADIASPLLQDIVFSIDNFIDGKEKAAVVLRFGHAETLIPLLSLMRLPGAYYMTNYFDTVRQKWCDFSIVPMAANLQIVLFKTKKGEHYVRFDLNEKPIALRDGFPIYVKWGEARELLLKFIPMYYQAF